jgi:hypothetical protein
MNRDTYRAAVRAQLAESLHYPLGTIGELIDGGPAIFLGLGWHLERDGWRRPYSMTLIPEWDIPVIKKRKVYGPGVYEDAVTWVDFNEPDDPLENLADMTISQIEALPEDLKLEAKRRLGMLPPPPEPDPQPAWTQPPLVNITNAPDENTEWSN